MWNRITNEKLSSIHIELVSLRNFTNYFLFRFLIRIFVLRRDTTLASELPFESFTKQVCHNWWSYSSVNMFYFSTGRKSQQTRCSTIYPRPSSVFRALRRMTRTFLCRRTICQTSVLLAGAIMMKRFSGFSYGRWTSALLMICSLSYTD